MTDQLKESGPIEAAMQAGPERRDYRDPGHLWLAQGGAQVGLRSFITAGPFSLFFTNINTEMGLGGHSHFGTVSLTWETLGTKGFPSFAETHDVLQQEIKEFTALPFRGYTNEKVAIALWARFEGWGPDAHPILQKWGGDYRLSQLELAVRGVPDKIGHADGFTNYRVVRSK